MDTATDSDLVTLVGASEIAHRIDEMGRDIVADYGDELTMVVMLKHGFVFAADLLRALGRAGARVGVEFVQPDPRGGNNGRGGPSFSSLKGRRVLVVDAILDTGRSALRVLEQMREAGAAEVRLAVLLDRPARVSLGLIPDYTGFILPDRYVVGYGIGSDGRHCARTDVAADGD